MDLSDMDGKIVTLAGTIANIRVHITKKGYPMAFIALEDLHGFADLVVFPDVWKQVNDWLEIDTLVAVSGKVDTKRGEANLLVNNIDRELKVVEIADEQVIPRDLPKNSRSQENDRDFDTIPDEPKAVEIHENNKLHFTDHELSELNSEDLMVVHERPISETVSISKEPPENQSSDSPRRIVVTLRPEDKQSDYQLRVKWAFNVLNSFPGDDRFVMVVYETDDRCFELDFSNHTTGYCEDLRQQLMQVVNSEDDIEIQSLLL